MSFHDPAHDKPDHRSGSNCEPLLHDRKFTVCPPVFPARTRNPACRSVLVDPGGPVWCNRPPLGRVDRMLSTAGKILSMIKFEHSVFSLPYAIGSAVQAATPETPLSAWLWILVAMVSARSAAMAFNRLVDADLDAKNPRTEDREIPRGRVTRTQAGFFVACMAAIFLGSAAMLNPTCLLCAPVVLLILLGYSYAKRFTWLCHFWLGVSLGLAPLGAWIALRESLELLPVLLGASLAFSIAGFDLLYACLDADHDSKEGIYSIPGRFGVPSALVVSRACHIITLAIWVAMIPLTGLGSSWLASVGAGAFLLAYAHRIVSARDLSRVMIAFFPVNAALGMVILAGLVLDSLLNPR